ncbi:Conserved glutamic acid rich protein [Coniochaeta hoffmannii]|uniref:Conserved glutamic acid rich protein n=1 Tax=Coniochaeta hoffmannii TaxID=91930 RepID=A0AA38RDJ6_9PEZI|nr:Conserved glutamic acid rich protein [Coniochaeta hoffmannii]
MAYRGGGSRADYEERDHYERSRSRAGVREYEDVDLRVRERERDRVPAFMREEIRRPEPGPLVLRARDVETVERPRRRSPSVTRVRAETREVVRARSVTPPPPRRREVVERDDVEVRTRTVERERVRSPSRVRTRFIERERSPSPERVRTTRYVERRRSPSPVVDRERIRIIEHERERARTPSPSPSPSPPPVIRGPRIEREVVTHYTGIDHGIIQVRPPSPPPPPRQRQTERETDIDIYTSRHETEVDVHRRVSHSRGRARSPSVERRRPSAPAHYHDDEVIVRSDRNRLDVEIDHHHHPHRSMSPGGHRRAHSAAPGRVRYDDEAEYITSRIEERGRVGEAYHGATRDWEIVDVPPGTERVRMDGAGGGATEVTWSKYSGVRRAKFLPDGDTAVVRAPPVVSSRPRERERERETDTRINVQIYDDKKEERPVKEKKSDMWTEITKDLVSRRAIEEMGYEYEETEYFYYILTYLRYEDVLELVKLSDRIRRARKDRIREIEWERDYRDDWESDYRRHGHGHRGGYEDERIRETEVIYDSGRPARGYIR